MAVDPIALRSVLSRFATGVTVVGTRHSSGGVCGLTANAFTSVSLSPAQVLVCVGRTSNSFPCLVQSGVFVASFLAWGQHAVAARFAERRPDKFEGIAHRLGVTGSPIIEGAVGHVECEIVAEYPGGDHSILIGRVVGAGVGAGRPLVFFSGGYATTGDLLTPAAGEALPDAPEPGEGPGA